MVAGEEQEAGALRLRQDREAGAHEVETLEDYHGQRSRDGERRF